MHRTQNDKLNRRWEQQGTTEEWNKYWKNCGEGGHWTASAYSLGGFSIKVVSLTAEHRTRKFWMGSTHAAPYTERQRVTFSLNAGVRARWRHIAMTLVGSILEGSIHHTLFHTIAQAMKFSKRRPGNIVLVMEICKTIWDEPNQAAYLYNYQEIPCWVIV